jgi:hypothetical protein
LDRVTQGNSSGGIAQSAGVALIGGAISAYALLDAYVVGPVVIGLSDWLDPFAVFGVATGVLTLVNVACCSWLERRGHGHRGDQPNRIEAMLERLGSSRLMRRPLAWITDGSAAWFALAAVTVNAIFVVGVARFVGGRRVSRRRILLASAAYSISFAAFFVAVGFGAGGAIRGL